jgi:hypothetical protein
VPAKPCPCLISLHLCNAISPNLYTDRPSKSATSKKSKLDAVIDADIPWIVRRAVNDCKTVPKLLYFTEGYQHGNKHTNLHIANSALISLTELEDEEAEHALTKSEAQEALTNWLDLLVNKEPEGTAMWREMLNTHLFGMQKDPHTWEEQLEYILLLRHNCTPYTNSIPSWDWEAGWTRAISKAARRKEDVRSLTEVNLQSQVTALQSQLQSLSSFRPSHASTTETNSQKRQPSLANKTSAVPPKPGPTANKPFTDKKDLFCIVCGAKGDHSKRNCKAPAQLNGNPIKLTPTGDGHWKWLGGGGVCYNWNGRHSCPNTPTCPNGTHACTLCQEPDHGAVRCPSQ